MRERLLDAEGRQRQLREFSEMLNTPVGEAFVEELEAIWNPIMLYEDNPHKQAYVTGLRDAFVFIQEIQNQTFEGT